MAYGDELVGVKGWLLLFVVILGVFTPASSVFGIYAALYSDPGAAAAYETSTFSTLEMVAWLLVVLSTAICWFVVYRLVRVRNWTTVRIAIAGILATSIGAVAVEFAAVSWILGIPAEALASALGPDLVRPVVFSVIWITYLLRSRRVANTYGDDFAEEHVTDVFA